MAKLRLGQLQVLSMVMNTWHRGQANPRFGQSVTRTAWFLWAIVLAGLLLGAAAVVMQLLPHAEEHCDDPARAGTKIECPERVESHPAWEVGDVGHHAMVPVASVEKYVHGAHA
ncbi:MAG: hypothetical protein ABIP44_05735 [Pseudoxanthomonas sp.]